MSEREPRPAEGDLGFYWWRRVDSETWTVVEVARVSWDEFDAEKSTWSKLVEKRSSSVAALFTGSLAEWTLEQMCAKGVWGPRIDPPVCAECSHAFHRARCSLNEGELGCLCSVGTR